jgi:hypothetical protein
MQGDSGYSSGWQHYFLWAVGGFSLFGCALGLATPFAIYVVLNQFHAETLDRVTASDNPVAVAQVQALIADGHLMMLVCIALWLAATSLIVPALVLIRRETRR